MSEFIIESATGITAIVDSQTPAQVIVEPAQATSFVIDGALQGPQGNTGATGQTGATGATGAQGLPGTNGTNGTNGNVWALGVPTESPNGVRTVFTVPAAYITGGLAVFLNGLRETFVTESSTTTFTFSSAPFTGDTITLFYRTS